MSKCRENEISDIFDCFGILQKKYLEYFCTDYQKENEVLLNGFLADMAAMTEKAFSSVLKDIIPPEVLHSICERFSMPFSVNSLRVIISGEC